MPTSGNMVSSFLGGSQPSYDPFAGTSLGRGFGQGIASNLPDYSSVFSSAVGAGAGGRTSGGALSGFQPLGIPIPSDRSGGKWSSRPATSRPSYGGGGGGGSLFAPAPIEFSLGPAPTLEELQVDYETLGRRAMEANVPFAQQYRQFAPQTEAGTRALSQAGATMAAGVLPRDVTGQVGRSAAALGFQTGLGGRSGIGRNILARDLGLSSLQVQAQGADLLNRSSLLAQQAMQAMAPIAPQQVFQTAFGQAQYNREIANQNLLNAWLSRPLPGQFDVTRGQYVGFQPGAYSATRPLPPGTVSFRPGSIAAAGQRNWIGSLASSPIYGA